MTMNPWEDAVAAVSDKDRNTLFPLGTGTFLATSELLSLVELRKAECIAKRLTVRGPNKEVIVVRDIYFKIAQWINKFIQVGDVVAQVDPIHVGLPWAAVRLILIAAVNHAEKDAVILDSVQEIARILSLGAIYENLYLRSTTQVSNDIHAILLKVYSGCLSLLAKAARFYKLGKPKHILTSIVKFYGSYKDRLTVILHDLSNLESQAALADAEIQQAHVQSTDELHGILKDLHGLVRRHESISEQAMVALGRIDSDAALDWTSSVAYMSHHRERFGRVLEGTGSWLLNHETTVKWRQSSSSQILWLHGIPGSGKSSLVSILVEQLRNESKDYDTALAAHFYCSRDTANPQRAQPLFIVRTLLRQLAISASGDTIDGNLLARYRSRRTDGDLDLAEATNAIIGIIQQRPETYLIIDALDECDHQIRWELIQALQDILNRSSGLVKIFVASRNDHDLVCWLDEYPNLEILASENANDIRAFIESEVERRKNQSPRRLMAKKAISSALASEIVEKLSSDAQGMFRWAELQLDYICTLSTEAQVRKRLGALPKTLHAIYNDIYALGMEEKEDEEVELSHLIFQFLFCGLRELKTADFCAFISLGNALDDDPLDISRVLQLTFNLVRHDPVLDVFRYAHLSVREFLETESKFPAQQSHEAVAAVCIKSLLRPVTLELNIPIYVYHYWAAHAGKSKDSKESGQIFNLLMDFVVHHEHIFLAWLQYLKFKHRIHVEDSRKLTESEREELENCIGGHAIFLASVYGFQKLMEFLLDRDLGCLNFRNERGVCALYLTARYSSEECLKLLLERGADVNCRGGGYGFPLQAASTQESTQNIRNLLDFGAEVNQEGGFFGSALQAAVFNNNSEIANILIDKGADPNLKGGAYQTALQGAAKQDNPDIVSLLLDKGAHINSQGGNHGSALQAAAHEGHEKVVRLLLDKGADPDIVGGSHNSALQAAVAGGYANIVQMLLDGNANVNVTGSGYGSALQAAAYLGHDAFICSLLDKGADININGSIYGNSLYLASLAGRPDIVKRLIDRGVEVNNKSGRQKSALEVAIVNNHEEVANILIDAGASFGSTLQTAAWCGHSSIVSTLLKRGADINGIGRGGTALQLAANSGKAEAVKVLLEYSPDLKRTTRDYGTALHEALDHKHDEIVGMLIEAGAEDDDHADSPRKPVANGPEEIAWPVATPPAPT